MNDKKIRGFTLIELLVVIAILAVLATIVLAGLNSARKKARDIHRIASFRSFQKGLEAYNIDKGYYPAACGNGYYSFTYAVRNTDGSCGGGISLRFDNSSSNGFLANLFPEYVNMPEWNDPLKPSNHANPHNCRYVIPSGEGNCADPDHLTCAVNCKPKRYFLHCLMEGDSYIAQNDDGTHNQSFEIASPITGFVLQVRHESVCLIKWTFFWFHFRIAFNITRA